MSAVKFTPDDPAGLLYYESRVAQALGLERKRISQLRAKNLKEGSDFIRIENNAVALTAPGLAKVEALLAASGPDKSGLPSSTGRKTGGKPPPNGKPAADIPPGPKPRELMKINRVSRENTKILLCIPKTRPQLVAVKVADNTNFIPGMDIEAMRSDDGVWQFRNRPDGQESTCGRLPRGKGRW